MITKCRRINRRLMRLKNVPKAPQILRESPYFIEEPLGNKGHWNRVFGNENPIFVEVGSGKGQFIVESARQNKDANFIGIEMYESVLYKAATKLEALGEDAPKNIRLVCVDARRLGEIFEKGEVGEVYANFSDPWPRRRHAKRRLTSCGFLELYKRVLAPKGRLVFKTDNEELFEYSLKTIEYAEGWELIQKTYDLHADEELMGDNIITEYEAKFSAMGKPIYKLWAGILSLVLALILAVFPSYTSYAAKVWPTGIDISSDAMAVVEQKSGVTLLEKHSGKKKYPASITKIMTALVALENSTLNEKVIFSEDAVFLNEGDSSHISRDVGEKMTMEECLYGMMLESANECAWAIAEHVAGSEPKFVDMMNKRAKELGCKNTHFSNPNGLPDENHYTCANDMALIARAAFENRNFRTIIGTKSYTIPPTNTHASETPLNNHHAMLHNYKTDAYIYDGCLGGKTGYTDSAGYTLVTYAKRGGLSLVCVVLDAPSPDFYTDTIRLFDYCFSNFITYSASETGGLLRIAKKNAGSLLDASDMFLEDDNSVVALPKTASILDVEVRVLPSKSDKDGVIGELAYSYGGHTIGSAKLRFAAMDGAYAYPFSNLKEKKPWDDSYIYIDLKDIGIGLGAAAGLAVLILLILFIAPRFHQKRARRRVLLEEKKAKYKRVRFNGRKRR